jgi:hypothetical protein
VKIVGVADSDSYLKWGAAVLGGMPTAWEKFLTVLVTPTEPSAAQRAAALAGTGMPVDEIRTLELLELARFIAEQQADVVFLALTGPAVRVVVRAVIAVAKVRPVFVSGMPGISFPATRRALLYRSQVDMILVHSKRERERFSELATFLGIEQRFGLATLAFLSREGGHSLDGTSVVFAAQAKVPRTKADRLSILSALSETALRHPELRVVMKMRAQKGEAQTHAERYPYDELADEVGDIPANLVFETGAMSGHLDSAAALVTVSSTAALEAAARGIPALVLDEFGVSAKLINLVFEGSNLLGGFDELRAARFRMADEEWLDSNYFHGQGENDWLVKVDWLLRQRAAAKLPLRVEARRGSGGALRHAWDRKRVLGSYDTSLSGKFALVVGIPAKWLYFTARGIRRGWWRPRQVVSEG